MMHNDVLNQASVLRILGKHPEAVELLRDQSKAVEFNCEVAELLYLCLVEMDLIAEATTHLESWLAASSSDESSHAVAGHLLSSLTGSPLPEQAPSIFVTRSFGAAMANFEKALEEFQYRGPELLQRLLVDNIGDNALLMTPMDRVLDAGCGTGRLCAVLRDYATVLEGVDLSPQMLRMAKETGAYNHLECQDMLTYLDNSVAKFDMIVAADSFIYFGNLKQLIRAAFGALKKDGWLVFSLQEGPLDKDSYFLRYDGTYIHSPQYLIEQLGEAGVLGGSIRRAVIRQQFGQNIWALLIAVQRPNEH